MEKTLETADAPAKKGRPYGGVAPEARAAERRDALIRAGTRVFGTVGFRKATVRAICQEAKLNDRYFYAAFDSTEALLRATYQQHAEDLRAQVSEATAAAGNTLEARVDAGLHAFFAFLRDPCAARVLLLEVMGVSPETDATYQRNLLEFGKQIMANAELPGAPLEDNAEQRADQRILGLALVGALTNVGAAWLLTGYRDPEEKMVRNCRQVVLGTLRAMLGV
ncbi:MAG: TetR/AcrR family transcriptional regulator [Ralstonia sp.]|jgi:AcrR family transcriptional regulator|uniref:TetR/AcrR family transcriptional regulator n=2 Tax=Ralstonia pickettii TaxID=329 RepID=A0A2P4RHS9_RALPI|nr:MULTISPECIES: TetR/AcrR family transcriptional regulator [Ralstonia]MBA4199634.1 TetR/AcrR family transcriptional regulator [Ralstonia sp.]MBA4232716.1 TetR/AcrR family transcriptional regulator [Ralstonia sp.]MBA4235502.1 TetR/AcrR family transcriptional regulator [Ralstonia sp.]MBA4282366.1 TetR/AcrR family transcriptional regulator [Ralstonia sp.]MBA4296518.1 TetR/AcrR family transcriptional regulator [Ralstonia sp.]